jgi:hypothetical protein
MRAWDRSGSERVPSPGGKGPEKRKNVKIIVHEEKANQRNILSLAL